MLFSRLDALSGLTAMTYSTSFNRLSDMDCLLHPDSTNMDIIIMPMLFFICLSRFSFVAKIIIFFISCLLIGGYFNLRDEDY